MQLRLRTPATGANGIEPDTRTMEILEAGRSYFVAATYDGYVSRIFVDGNLLGRRSLAAHAAAIPGLQDASPRVWAALSTSGMAGLILPPDPGELVLAPDGDAPGRKAANKLADRGSAAGWRVRIMRCPEGSDWNDVESEVAA